VRTRDPAFAGLEWLRLFLSYQRYGLLLMAAALAPLALVYALAPTIWWMWLLAAIPGVWVGNFAITVLRRFPKKLRLTAIANRRITQGSFSPRSVAGYCEDPCFRVVAHEILRRAGVSAAERRALVEQFAARASANATGMVVFDHERGTVTHIDGEGRLLSTTTSTRSQAKPT
jgi:hypothetical protein